ncbi:MAG: hypothetical protein IID31_05675 [Planctomycetes bacterium]|nr:hypothetical protein [Planctomycetota bacterium]
MGGEPRLTQAWIREYYGDEIRAERAELKRRLRHEKASEGPIDDTGPMVRLTAAWMRGDRQLAMEIARAVDIALDWYGDRLPREPEGDGLR